MSYTGTAPAIGDEMGTVIDSFDFEKDKTGFMCVGVDTGGSKCLVRPFSNRGGTTGFYGLSPTSFSVGYTGTGRTDKESGIIALSEDMPMDRQYFLIALKSPAYVVQGSDLDTVGDISLYVRFMYDTDPLTEYSFLLNIDITSPSFGGSGLNYSSGGLTIPNPTVMDPDIVANGIQFKFSTWVNTGDTATLSLSGLSGIYWAV